MQRPGGRSARIAEAVRSATIAQLLEHGIDGLAIEAIATRAGVNKTTIYRRWRTREGLIADALVANSGSQITTPDTGSVRNDLIELALQVRDAIRAPASLALMSAMAGGRHHRELDEIGRRFWAGRFAAARPIIDRAIKRGELPQSTDHEALISRIVGPIWFRVFGPGADVDTAFVTESVDIVLTGTLRRSESSGRAPSSTSRCR